MVELKVEGLGIRPEDLTGDEVFIIRKEHDDVISSTERSTNNKKGVFTQYTLFLATPTGEDKELRYLFGKHLNPLIKQWGNKSENWEGNAIKIKPMQKGEFWDCELVPDDYVEEEKIDHKTSAIKPKLADEELNEIEAIRLANNKLIC